MESSQKTLYNIDRHADIDIVCLYYVSNFCYAPTNEATAEAKDLFYNVLEDSFCFTRLIICLGDFNAVTGVDRRMPAVVSPFGSESPNDNSDRFLKFCASVRLRVCGSWFYRKDIHRLTWHSNDGVTAKEVDHILDTVIKTRPPPRFNIGFLRDYVTAATYAAEVEKCFVAASEEEFSSWNSFCDAMTKMADKALDHDVPMRHE
ncbi:hypothetical protein HELRODRAFT_174206 [Helobdella robusta]|uniref:Endonuclease/exonuclease/phosphatase domain-containing protein n=1 Tax=Helobdella robusta TaxID=6412 RepID=T1F7S5_HELRO|nr:hypothetical protein HELRODRAFT_174206 [Helobdella robusta]ESO02788.1 hypothetical protein HELRODRAFT_174206 [Helobdella robusta]